ncbi:MAG: cadherin domain-containing protein [Bacteroidota bacterium]
MKKNYLFTLFVILLLISNKFTLGQNWVQKADFDSTARFGAVSFTIGDSAYVGLGDDGDVLHDDFLMYNSQTDSWSTIAEFPGDPRKDAIAFSINGKGYVGLGTDGYPDFTRYKDFYEYDPETDSWSQVSDFGGTGRSGSVAFVIDGFAYVGTGKDDGGSKKDFWVYDPSNDIWEQVADLASNKRYGAVGFSVNGKGYVGAGKESSSYQLSDVYEYDPVNDSWTERIYADGTNLGFEGASSFVVNDIAYICYGNQDYITTYNPANNEVNKLGDVLGFGDNRFSPIGFELNEKGYFGLGYMGGFDPIYYTDIWQFTPPNPPTAINLSDTSVIENVSANTEIGTLSADDPDDGDTHTFSLVDTEGDYGTDNGSFSIDGNSLIISESPDYETQMSYLINIKVEDSEGLSCEEKFEIVVLDENEPPESISITSDKVIEEQAPGTEVGVFSNDDPDTGDSQTYSFANEEGNEDSIYFKLEGNKLLTDSTLDYESESKYSLQISCADTMGHTCKNTFDISVIDINEKPYDISLDPDSIEENAEIGDVVGSFSALDPDNNSSFTYSLVSGNGTNDQENSMFTIEGSDLIVDDSLDYEERSECNIYVRTTDQGGLIYEKGLNVKVLDVDEEEGDDDSETAILPLNETQISVYPNPTDGGVHLQIKEALFNKGMELHIFNTNGTIVQSRIINKPETKLELFDLPGGMYFIKIPEIPGTSMRIIIKK